MGNNGVVFNRIEIAILLGLGLIFDALSVVPLLNIATDFIGWLIVFLIFKLKGVSFTRNKSVIANAVAAFIIGLIPVVSAIPEFTLAIGLDIRSINKNGRKMAQSGEKKPQGIMSRITRVDTTEVGDADYRLRMNKSNAQAANASTFTSSGTPGRVSKSIRFGRTIPQLGQTSSASEARVGNALHTGGSFTQGMLKSNPIIKTVGQGVGMAKKEINGLPISSLPNNQLTRTMNTFESSKPNNNVQTQSEQRPSISNRMIGKTEEATGAATEAAGKAMKYSGQATQYSGRAVQGAGKAAELGGKAVQAVGKGVSSGGTAAVDAGAALSETGIGAIAGVPLMILGGAAVGVGKITEAGGAATSAAGKAAAAAGKATAEAGAEVRAIGKQAETIGQQVKEEGKERQALVSVPEIKGRYIDEGGNSAIMRPGAGLTQSGTRAMNISPINLINANNGQNESSSNANEENMPTLQKAV